MFRSVGVGLLSRDVEGVGGGGGGAVGSWGG